jgi:hypothetical protein
MGSRPLAQRSSGTQAGRVIPRQEPGPGLLVLAAEQDGVVTTAQVRAAGLSTQALYRLEQTGRWLPLERSVHLTAPGPPSWRSLAWAGVLLGGAEARLGGPAAAHLHGLVEAPPHQILVLVPAWAVTRDRGPWRFRREGDGVRGPSVGAPPRTSVEDTVLDLCGTGSAAQAIGWVTGAVGARRTTAEHLRRTLDHRRRVKHRQLLAELLGDVAQGVESPLELRYLRDVELAHGLPRGERQDRSELPFRRDVVYRAFRLVVELDGRLGHEGAGLFRDMRRDNRTALTGEMTLRYGSVDVLGRPCVVARQVEAALQLRGWAGRLTPCRRCGTDKP